MSVLEHEMLLPTGPVNQEFTFTLDGSTISVEPPLPLNIANLLAGEWKPNVILSADDTDSIVDGFTHTKSYFDRNFTPCREVVTEFRTTAQKVLLAGGNYAYFVIKPREALVVSE